LALDWGGKDKKGEFGLDIKTKNVRRVFELKQEGTNIFFFDL